MRSEIFPEGIFGLSPLGQEGVKTECAGGGDKLGNGVGQREVVRKFEAGAFKSKDKRWTSECWGCFSSHHLILIISSSACS